MQLDTNSKCLFYPVPQKTKIFTFSNYCFANACILANVPCDFDLDQKFTVMIKIYLSMKVMARLYRIKKRRWKQSTKSDLAVTKNGVDISMKGLSNTTVQKHCFDERSVVDAQPTVAGTEVRHLTDYLRHHGYDFGISNQWLAAARRCDNVKWTCSQFTRMQANQPTFAIHVVNWVALKVRDSAASNISSKWHLQQKKWFLSTFNPFLHIL